MRGTHRRSLAVACKRLIPEGRGLASGCASRLHTTILLRHCLGKKGITIVVHNGDMRASSKPVRQSIGLPRDTARKVRSPAKQRRLSANRIIVELVEKGIEAEKSKQKEFFELAERFRAATDPKEVARLGDDLGRMVFGD